MLLENCALTVIRASRPTFRNSHDKLAFSLHATFFAYGYLLTAVGLSALQDSAFSSSSNEVSVDGWNSLDEDYAFLYHNPHNSMKVLVRCLTMNEKLLIDVFTNVEESDLIHLEIDTEEYVEEGDADKSNYKDYYKNFPKLIKILKTQLFSKLSMSYNNVAADLSVNNSHSSSNSTGERLQVYAYPQADQIHYPDNGLAYVYPIVPVYNGRAAPVWQLRPQGGRARGRGRGRGRGPQPDP